MVKITRRLADQNDPLFNEGITIPSRKLKSKKILYIDMDNVLVDFPSGIAALSEQDRATYEDRLDEVPGIFSKMLPKEGAVAAFQELSKHFDTYILSTAPWENPSAWSDKLIWVKEYLGESAHKRLILSHNKHRNKGDYLIDDRPHNGAKDFEGELIPFHSQEFPESRFKTWDDILNYLLPDKI